MGVERLKESFGSRVRKKRLSKGISVRGFSLMLNVSSTYISQIELERFDPPNDIRILQIAEILDENADEMLALAGRIPADIPDIILKYPSEISTFLRVARKLGKKDWKDLTGMIS